MLCMKKGSQRQKGRRHNGQQPGTKSAFRPADKTRINRGQTTDELLINRGSTAGFVPPLVYIGFPLFVLAKRRSGQLFTVPGGVEGRLPSGPTEMSAPFSAQLRPAPPSAVRRADPTRSFFVRVLNSTGCWKMVKAP